MFCLWHESDHPPTSASPLLGSRDAPPLRLARNGDQDGHEHPWRNCLLLGCFPAKRTLISARRSAVSDPKRTPVASPGSTFLSAETAGQSRGRDRVWLVRDGNRRECCGLRS